MKKIFIIFMVALMILGLASCNSGNQEKKEENFAPDLVISPTALDIEDTLFSQIRSASYQVGNGTLTIDEAVAKYGSFE